MVGKQERPDRVDLGTLYALYAFEFCILWSVILARREQAKSTQMGNQAIKEGERKSNAEIIKRRTEMLNAAALLGNKNKGDEDDDDDEDDFDNTDDDFFKSDASDDDEADRKTR